jgi:hypothetical protein
VIGTTHGSGDLAPKPDLAAGAVAIGGALTMTEPAVGASSLPMQTGAVTLEPTPEVDITTTTCAVGMTDSVVEAVGAVHNTSTRVPEVSPLPGVASTGGDTATMVMATSSRLSWGTSVSELRGKSAFPMQCAHLILRYAKRRTCSNGRGSTLSKSSSASRHGVPCSTSKPPLKSKRLWRKELLDKMELLLNQEQIAIGLLDAKAQKLMEAEARADTTIKQ